jgi:predicted GIY-YIG superfamily endonuclease
MGIIYCLSFSNGKKYIGQTRQPITKRLKQHKKQSYCTAVHNAIIKYKDYECRILVEVDNNELDDYEERYIKEYNTIVPNG